MRVGMVCTSMSRSAGGIAPVVMNLSRSLQAAGLGVTVFAGEDESSAKDIGDWAGVDVRLHKVFGPSALAWQPRLGRSLQSESLDVFHQHGLWTYPSLQGKNWPTKKVAKIVSPHGMLDSWALNHSAWKKKAAFRLFERSNLVSASCIHALCDAEKEAIRNCGIRNPVAVIPNGVDLEIADRPIGTPLWAGRVPLGAKVALFLGRIHPKKGLDRLLRALSISKGQSASDWHFVVAGWDQGGARQALETLARDLGLSDKVHFVGPQFGDEKRSSFARADLFVLPSLSEGLPMAVLEAWSFRLPVLMTDHCNLPEGFAAEAAIRMDTNVESIAKTLDGLCGYSVGDLEAMGQAGRELVEARFTWDIVSAQLAEVYKWACGTGERPDFVCAAG